MTNLLESEFLALESWAKRANEAGWLPDEELAQLELIEKHQAEMLFAQQGQRPLIVAFFGGTGVGKSSLLNRLAGGEIARVGIERPTSHEVTLYLHQDYRIDKLPEELPIDQTRIAYHNDDHRRLIAWLDMPDIDSVEQRHHEMVKAWLPYIDWLVYVVSPERYQDDLGWQFLQQRGNRHSWLFVINHWDQGDEVQARHLSSLLESEGFSNPVILRTSCMEGTPEDEFPALETTINQAIRTHGMELLQRLGIRAQNQEVQELAARYTRVLDSWNLKALMPAWKRMLNRHLTEMETELQLNADLHTRSLSDNSGFTIKKPEIPPEKLQQLPERLPGDTWNGRIDTRMSTMTLELENMLRDQGIPMGAIEQAAVSGLNRTGRERFLATTSDVIVKFQADPGGIWGRGLYRFVGVLSWLLPLMAAIWEITYVVTAFYAGTENEGSFLGFDFAVHAVLLLLLSWLVPWLLLRKLQPSPVNAACNGLKRGIRHGIAEIRSGGIYSLERLTEDLLKHRKALDCLRDCYGGESSESIEPETARAGYSYHKRV
ncbi:MAG: hypothetical protein GY703_07335 [Gammaproteobacteria bacterium]|nr:hypothetical protein [Gammaproteobacteria bacterium]